MTRVRIMKGSGLMAYSWQAQHEICTTVRRGGATSKLKSGNKHFLRDATWPIWCIRSTKVSVREEDQNNRNYCSTSILKLYGLYGRYGNRSMQSSRVTTLLGFPDAAASASGAATNAAGGLEGAEPGMTRLSTTKGLGLMVYSWQA